MDANYNYICILYINTKKMKPLNILTKILFITFLSGFFTVSGTQTCFAQTDTSYIYELSKSERKLAKKKDLKKVEMIYLIKKHGYSLEQIQNTPTEELKTTLNWKEADLKDLYNRQRVKIKELEKKIAKSDSINNVLHEKIKILEAENKALKSN